MKPYFHPKTFVQKRIFSTKIKSPVQEPPKRKKRPIAKNSDDDEDSPDEMYPQVNTEDEQEAQNDTEAEMSPDTSESESE